MHIEKNICESIIGTLLHIHGKCKDSEKAWLDMKHLTVGSASSGGEWKVYFATIIVLLRQGSEEDVMHILKRSGDA
jgi:hypothetical protein